MIDFQLLLKPQSLMKVVLNGGKQMLDDATIPFTIGLNDALASKQPTHVLVVDIPHSQYKGFSLSTEQDDESPLMLDNEKWRRLGERRLYELNKIDFIQFHSPGKHNLIFILLKDPSKDMKKRIFQKASLRNSYDNGIYLSQIQNGGIEKQVAYCEELVEIPDAFFSLIPQSGFKRGWWEWVNRWFLTDPVDQCEFRKRAILALTIQPICWFFGFLPRLILSVALGILLLALTLFIFLCGGQSKSIPQNVLRLNWDFLFLYRKLEWRDIFSTEFFGVVFDEDEYYDYKILAIGKRRIKIPISLLGLAIGLTLWGLFLTSFPLILHSQNFGEALKVCILGSIIGFAAWMHLGLVASTMRYDKIESWVYDHYHGSARGAKKLARQALVFVAVVMLFFFTTQLVSHLGVIADTSVKTGNFLLSKIIYIAALCLLIMAIMRGKRFLKYTFQHFGKMLRWFGKTNFWLGIMKKLKQFDYWLGSLLSEIKKENVTASSAKQSRSYRMTKADWLRMNMNINQMPVKVNINETVAPTKIGQAILKFKVTFWATKAKVCKPYPKR
jgi:hypothetical protein